MDYRTLGSRAQARFEEKRSRFIGAAAPVQTEEEALAFVASRRREHPEASHHVYAFALRAGGLRRFSDDGEPSGTGGRPVLDVLTGSGLTDAAIVVTRYFGGTLLGAGGLVRAYAQGARLALEAAPAVEMTSCARLRLQMDYGYYDKMLHLLARFRTAAVSSDFAELVTLELLVKDSDLEPLLALAEELSGARIAPRIVEKLHAPFPARE